MAKKLKTPAPEAQAPSGAPAQGDGSEERAFLLQNADPTSSDSPSVPVPVIVIEPMPGELERDEIAQALAAEEFGKVVIDSRPNISHLDDACALVDGEKIPLFGIGDKIVIERTYQLLGEKRWLDTNVYEVTDIDDLTGALKLYNHELNQFAMSAFKGAAAESTLVIKLANEVGGLDHVAKRKRGRPRKNPALQKKGDAATSLPGNGEKRRRGRPPGSKNRSKDVIKAEKESKKLERSAKKGRGKSKR